MIAINTIRTDPHYRRAAFDAGLKLAGYTLVTHGSPKSRADLLVTWNRQGPHEAMADSWEADGGTVLVCENGYLGQDNLGRQLYAISVHGHNGSGWYPVGTEDRFAPLDIELKPWHEDAGHILVCGQRGIGSRTMASPPQWEDKTAHTLKAMGHTAIKLRRHPGRFPPATTLEADLSGARVCVVWSSASGVKALTLGVPVVYAAPRWICAGAATHGLKTLETLCRSDANRLSAMQRLAYGQWTVAEIEAGTPFTWIMSQIGSALW